MARITLPSHDVMVANIAAVLHSATAEQRDAGMSWYADAHTIASGLAADSGYSVAQCAGVIAAVSPNNSWGRNVALASRIVRERGMTTSGYFALGLGKASSILRDTGFFTEIGSISEHAVIGDILNGQKIVAFFEGISTNGKTDTVCVDRHAYCIAINDRTDTNSIPSITPARYAAISAAYQAVAAGTQYTAAQVQAITWVAWRERFWAVGAFNTAIG